jgi:hypothetical protein
MSATELFGIAAHLHVLLRRKTGRVTDTEWLAVNPDYAREIVRFAREKGRADGHADLLALADRLEAGIADMGHTSPRRPLLEAAADALRAGRTAPDAPAGLRATPPTPAGAAPSGFPESRTGTPTTPGGDGTPRDNRYVGRLR